MTAPRAEKVRKNAGPGAPEAVARGIPICFARIFRVRFCNACSCFSDVLTSKDFECVFFWVRLCVTGCFLVVVGAFIVRAFLVVVFRGGGGSEVVMLPWRCVLYPLLESFGCVCTLLCRRWCSWSPAPYMYGPDGLDVEGVRGGRPRRDDGASGGAAAPVARRRRGGVPCAVQDEVGLLCLTFYFVVCLGGVAQLSGGLGVAVVVCRVGLPALTAALVWRSARGGTLWCLVRCRSVLGGFVALVPV